MSSQPTSGRSSAVDRWANSAYHPLGFGRGLEPQVLRLENMSRCFMQWSYLHFVKTPDEIFCWVSTDWCLVDLYSVWSTSEHPTVDVESRTVNGAHEMQSQTSTHLHAVVALSLSFSLLKETHWVGLGLAKRGSQTSGNRSRRWRIESCVSELKKAF